MPLQCKAHVSPSAMLTKKIFGTERKPKGRLVTLFMYSYHTEEFKIPIKAAQQCRSDITWCSLFLETKNGELLMPPQEVTFTSIRCFRLLPFDS